MTIINYTRKQLIDAWYEMFDENPWLQGLDSNSNCNDPFCCPAYVKDWGVLDQARFLHDMLGGQSISKITKGLHRRSKND